MPTCIHTIGSVSAHSYQICPVRSQQRGVRQISFLNFCTTRSSSVCWRIALSPCNHPDMPFFSLPRKPSIESWRSKRSATYSTVHRSAPLRLIPLLSSQRPVDLVSRPLNRSQPLRPIYVWELFFFSTFSSNVQASPKDEGRRAKKKSMHEDSIERRRNSFDDYRTNRRLYCPRKKPAELKIEYWAQHISRQDEICVVIDDGAQ